MRVLRVLSILVLVTILLAGADALAQRGGGGPGGRGGGGRGGPGGGFGGFGRGGTDALAFIQRDDVKNEIKLSSSQADKVAALAEASRGQGRGGFDFGSFRDMSEEERSQAMARMREQREEQQREQRAKLNEILSPDQQKRLGELQFQYALQQGRLDAALAAADIELDDDARQKLQDAQRDAAEKIQQEIAALQLKLNSQALAAVLDSNRIDQLLGKAFTFEQQQPRFGGGGRGGFGGPFGGFGGPGGSGQGRGGNARPERPTRPSGDSDANPRRTR